MLRLYVLCMDLVSQISYITHDVFFFVCESAAHSKILKHLVSYLGNFFIIRSLCLVFMDLIIFL